jgi:hypothetical protein
VGSGTSDDAKVSKWKRDLSEDVELEWGRRSVLFCQQVNWSPVFRFLSSSIRYFLFTKSKSGYPSIGNFQLPHLLRGRRGVWKQT